MTRRIVKITMVVSVEDDVPMWPIARLFTETMRQINRVKKRRIFSMRSITVEKIDD